MMSQQPSLKAKLEQEILLLQGFRPMTADPAAMIDIGPMASSFPYRQFPVGGIHEFLVGDESDSVCTTGFIAGILSHLMLRGGAVIWITATRKLFPPAFKQFGIEPDRLILIDLKKEKEALWVMEEALQCTGLAAVVGELNQIDLTASRRLQLAVEKSRVTGFIIRAANRRINTIACVARWQVSSLASEPEAGMPGVSFPRWKVELLRVRNGRTGCWTVEWRSRRFRFPTEKLLSQLPVANRKTG